jgi:anthranilate synthase component 2
MIDNHDSFTYNLVHYLQELSCEFVVVQSDARVARRSGCIGQVYGAAIVRAGQVMHGKTSLVHHAGRGVFADLPNSFQVTRYHSLVIDKTALPDCLEVTAWTETPDGEVEAIMGVRHRWLAVEGVQFHPESILTQNGHAMLARFLGIPLPESFKLVSGPDQPASI